jgi:hypothetical protein
MFQTPVYGFAMFQLLLSYVPMVSGTDVAYPFNDLMKISKLFWYIYCDCERRCSKMNWRDKFVFCAVTGSDMYLFSCLS